MKKLFYSIIVFLLSATVFAQAPQSFKYQAVARDASGEVIANQQVNFQISILQSSESGTVVYTETHVDSTNQFGLITLEIGTGTTTGDFTGIDWGSDAYFIQIEMDATGGTSYTLIGTSQLLSVPYAIYADSAGNTFSGDYSDLINKPNIIDSINTVIDTTTQFVRTELDGDATNEIQIFSVSATDDTLYLSAGNWVIIPGISAAQPQPPLTDYDGNVYQTVVIGNQVWMAENLKTIHFANGDAIPDGTGVGDIIGETEPKYWFAYNDDLNNVSTYGRLYTWHTVTNSRNVCPDDWHAPSDAEWKELEMYLGMSQAEADGTNYRGTDEGGKLKETGTIHWNSPNTGATNESNFTALPGGYRGGGGFFMSVGNFGYWWSSTESEAVAAYYRGLGYGGAYISRSTFFKEVGYSVRCVRDY